MNSRFSDTDIFVPPSVLLASSDPTKIRDPNAQVTGAIYAARRATSDAGKGRGGLSCMNQGSVFRALRRGRWLLVSDLFRGWRTWHGLLPPSSGSGQLFNDQGKKKSNPEGPWWRTSMHQCHSRLIAPRQYTDQRPGTRDRTLHGRAGLSRGLAWQICTTLYHNICLPRLRSHMSGLIFRLFFHCFPRVQRKCGRMPKRGVAGAYETYTQPNAQAQTLTDTHRYTQTQTHAHVWI